MKLIHTITPRVILGTLALTLASASAAPLSNGGFESGLSGWTESGGSGLFSTASVLQGFYASVSPTEGASFGLISNNGVDTERISQTFDITSNYLLFSYRFTSDEVNSGEDYNDSAHAVLTLGGNPATVFTVSRDDLQAGGVGSLLPGAAFIDNTDNGYDIGQAGWQSVVVDVSAYPGQSATLSFDVNNIGGSDAGIGVSQLAVDNVRQAAVPEPNASILLAAALGTAGLMRLRRSSLPRLA